MRSKLFIAPAAFGMALAFASVASADPILFNVDPSSNIAISIDAGALGSSAGSGGAQGNVDADLTAGNLTITSSSIDVDDINTTGTGTLGELNILNVHAFLTSTGPATDSGGGVYDLAGWELTLDQGIVVIPALGNLTAFDFSTGPLSLALPTVLSTLDTSGFPATWTIPINAVVTFSTLNNTVTVTVSGSFNLVEVPEPGTLLLLGAGLAGLVMTGRRRA